ncbi:MAG: hypothetical protein IJM84_02210, partial [Bacteroidaceae bacterium]|nr:hypothetical protein [Bacteroidaceae bacterium]
APYVDEKQQRFLERESSDLCPLPAAGAMVAREFRLARCARMLFFRKRRHFVRPPLPHAKRPQPDGPLMFVRQTLQ